MIVNFVLKSGAVRPAIVTQTYQFEAPDPAKPETHIWDRRHEGLINALVILDVFTDHVGADFDGKAIDGVFLPVQQVAYDENGAPGTWNNSLSVPYPTPPAPSAEFQTATEKAQGQGQSVAQVRAKTATLGG